MKNNKSAEGNASAVIDRMREAMAVETDAGLGEKLGVAPTTISNWRKRNTVPYKQVIEIALRCHLNVKWIITGDDDKGALYGSTPPLDLGLLQRVIIAVEENEPELRRRGITSTHLKAHCIAVIYQLASVHLAGLLGAGKIGREEALRAMDQTLPKFFEIFSKPQ